MTITDQLSTCTAEAAEARTVPVDATTSVYLRPHEGLVRLITGRDAGHRCASKTCGHAPIVQVFTAWDHRITSDYCRGGAGTWEFGEDRFATWRHADGTPCGTDEFGHRNPDGTYEPRPRAQVQQWARCGDCGAFDSILVTQAAYHDLTRCSCCGAEHSYSIGD